MRRGGARVASASVSLRLDARPSTPVSFLLRVHAHGLVERGLLLRRQRAVPPRRQIAETHGAIGEPRKTVHLEAHRLGPAAHDAIAPLGEGDVENAAPLGAGPHADLA